MTTTPAGPQPHPAVRLWADWCHATGTDPHRVDPDSLARHLLDCPAPSRRTRRSRVAAVLAATGATDPALRDLFLGAPPPPQPALRSGPDWLPLGEALARIDRDGYPTGVTGRRDAYLLVLLGPVGLTRARAITLTSEDVDVPDTDHGAWPTVAGVSAPFDQDPDRCAACAITRWVRVLAAHTGGGRPAAEAEVTGDPGGHRCGDPVDQGWVWAPTLAPRIDRHGWFGGPLTPRAVTGMTAARQDTTVPVPVTGWSGENRATGEPSEWMGRRPGRDTVLEDALDRLEAAIDETMTRLGDLDL